jgi:hypothetical protein
MRLPGGSRFWGGSLDVFSALRPFASGLRREDVAEIELISSESRFRQAVDALAEQLKRPRDLTGARVKLFEPVKELLTERFVTEISPESPTVGAVAEPAKESTEHDGRAVVSGEAWQDEHRMLISTRRGLVKKGRGCG